MKNMYYFTNTIIATAHKCLNKNILKEFWLGFCYMAGEITFKKTDELIFRIGNITPVKCEKGFLIKITQDGILVTAQDEKNLVRGYITLLDKIKAISTEKNKEKFGVEIGEWREYPPVANRMIHFCVFPDTKIFEIDRFIRICGALKFTHIVLEFWGMLKYDCLSELSWKHGFTKQEIKPLINMANDLAIDIIPMFNHWGHASQSRLNHGKHVILNQNPKLQYLFSDDGWVWRIDTPKVQNLLRSIRKELIELCGECKYFHLGCDEPYNFNLSKETAHIVTDYLNNITKELEDEGIRPIVWGDMLVNKRAYFNPANNYEANCPDIETEKELLENLNKKIIIADWQYWVHESPVETALIFKEAGFDTILCPWDEKADPHSIDACCDTAIENKLFGIMHTTWHTLAFGMPDITKCSELCLGIKNPENTHKYYGPRTASLLRKVYFVDGDYEKSGWSQFEIKDIRY